MQGEMVAMISEGNYEQNISKQPIEDVGNAWPPSGMTDGYALCRFWSFV